MAVAASGMISLPRSYARTQLANCAAFRTWTSAADVANALLRVHYNQVVVATLACTVTNGVISAVTVPDGGSGYTSAPTVTVNGDGTGASLTAVVSGGIVTSVTINDGGSDYTQDGTHLEVALPTMPFVVLFGGTFRRVSIAGGTRNYFITEPSDLFLAFRAEVNASHDEADALNTFENDIGGIMADMEELAGTAGYLNIMAWSWEELPQRPLEQETQTLEDFYRAVVRVEWQSA